MKINVAVTILMSLGLAACSSGGSSSHTETRTNITEVPSTITSGNGSTNINNSNVESNQNQTEPATPNITPATPVADNPVTNNPSTNGPVADNPTTNNSATDEPVVDNQPEILETNKEEKERSVYLKPDVKSFSAAYVKGSSDGNIYYMDNWDTNSPNAFNKLYLWNADAKEQGEEYITLIPDGVDTKKYNMQSAKYNIFLTRGEYALSGIVEDKQKGNYYIISQAKSPTLEMDMPVSGEFSYLGQGQHAAYYQPENGAATYDFNDSLVALKADFGNKTIRGEISSEQKLFETKQIGANIEGNGFSGKVNGISLYGAFVGENASEVTGQYSTGAVENPKDFVIGVFNATKQE